jgi:hypothetical protein
MTSTLEAGNPGVMALSKMLSRSEGEAAIAGLNGKTSKNRVLNLIEALPLSDNGSNACYNHRRGRRFSSRVRRGE